VIDFKGSDIDLSCFANVGIGMITVLQLKGMYSSKNIKLM